MSMRTGTLLIFVTLLLSGCGNDDSSVAEDSASSTPQAESATSGAGEQPTNTATTVDQMPWTFLIDGIYHNNATITSGQNPADNPNKGAWIDFKDNGTYDYGKYDKKEYSGSWFYDGDKEFLELNPEGEERPSEWQLKYKDNNLIWVGTNKYGDNATQMRWLRRQGYPARPVD